MKKSTLELIIEQIRTGAVYLNHARVNVTRDQATSNLESDASAKILHELNAIRNKMEDLVAYCQDQIAQNH